MKKYYLVSLGTYNKKPRQFFWMLDNGDTWIDLADQSAWKDKNEADIIAEAIEAEHTTDLDWAKTPLLNDKSISGWLSRYGRFYGCPSYHHDNVAHLVLGMTVQELENRGWVRVFDERWFTCQQRLSAEQRNWLSENGYVVHD